jgi:hypothetical protein
MVIYSFGKLPHPLDIPKVIFQFVSFLYRNLTQGTEWGDRDRAV